MGDETWASIQLVKNKREIFREKLKRRKAERDTILSVTSGSGNHSPKTVQSSFPLTGASLSIAAKETTVTQAKPDLSVTADQECSTTPLCPGLDKCLLSVLSNAIPPITIEELLSTASVKAKLSDTYPPNAAGVLPSAAVTHLSGLLRKFASKEYLCLNDVGTVVSLELSKLKLQDAGTNKEKGELENKNNITPNLKLEIKQDKCAVNVSEKRKRDDSRDGLSRDNKLLRKSEEEKDDVMSLLSAQSIRERENKRVGEEILELLNKPSAKEKSLAQHFRSQGGAKVREFCPRGTAEECIKSKDRLSANGSNATLNKKTTSCGKLHFRKIIQPHTDESLGDCSFLNTCFHMDTCRYVHYEVDYSGMEEMSEAPSADSATSLPILSDSRGSEHSDGMVSPKGNRGMLSPRRGHDRTVLHPAQWIQCDLRFLDMSILGKFSVIMADPPWDIHMELPYGTMSDDEMRQLNIPALQEEGLIFLWVTGRAMELGRECLTLWGYERVDEIIWVKTNQLQRIIRTGRTGHWLNHGKEHCLVGMKGKPKINRCMDSDVIVAEVRATSHKPDEIYGIIERLSPGTRKIELFGRHHNVQPNWLTLGNQLEGVNLMEEELRKFYDHYPDGVCGKR